MSPDPKGQGSPGTSKTMTNLFCRSWSQGRDKPPKWCPLKLGFLTCSQVLPATPHPLHSPDNAYLPFKIQPNQGSRSTGSCLQVHSVTYLSLFCASKVPFINVVTRKCHDRWFAQFPHAILSALRAGWHLFSLHCVSPE